MLGSCGLFLNNVIFPKKYPMFFKLFNEVDISHFHFESFVFRSKAFSFGMKIPKSNISHASFFLFAVHKHQPFYSISKEISSLLLYCRI